jgi:hypothetical protein
MAAPNLQTTICLPGETGWDLWKQGPSGMHLAQSMPVEDGGSPAAFKQVEWFGYPVLSTFSVPVWAASSDQEIIDGVVQIQLEKLSLAPDNPVGQLVDTRVVDRQESQTLINAVVLDEKVLSELPQSPPKNFEVSPYLFYLPDNSLVIWKELNRLVLCITRAEHPIYFQALTDSELSSAAVSEIESLLMPLYLQEIVGELESIVLWTDAIHPGAEQQLANVLHLPLRREQKPAPAVPKTPSSFEPVSIALGKIRAAKMKRIRKIITTCAAVYLGIIAIIAGLHLWKVHQNDELRQTVKRLNTTVGFVEPTMAQWKETAPLRDKNLYPIEWIRRSLEPLAARQFGGVRATNLRFEGELFEIKGEGQAQNVVINFGNWLRSNPDTRSLDWKGPEWGPQRSGTFTFTLRGTRKDSENGT